MPATAWPHPHREQYTDGKILPEVATIGWDRFVHAELSLGEHAHDCYEICYIVSGSVDWWAPDGVHEVSRGDVYITHPGEPHGGLDAMMHPCNLYWMHVTIPSEKPLPGLSLAQTQVLHRAFAKHRPRSFPGSPRLPEIFRRIIDEHRHRGQFATLSARAALHELLVCVLRDRDAARRAGSADGPGDDPITRAVAHIEADLTENWLVEQLAESVGLSVSRFHERFVQRTGLGPAEYRMRRRVRRAKQLLRDGDIPVTDLAQALGFSTSQYFATVFKNVTGLTPRAYRSRSQT